MSYQVLARKWRPQQFTELVGQDHVKAALGNALSNNRLHHAYLFTGTRGVGKTTIARIFAKSLNCETGVTATPCGVCSTCKEIEQGFYVDLLEIDAASRTKVEDTRDLLDNVQYAPSRGRYKVYLIDEVHMLSRHSFNALLKTLEEPPPHVKFLLATTDPQKLPVTVLSRCLHFSLKALSPEQIKQHLAYVLTQERIPFDEDALTLLARSAKGSLRDSLSLTDQAIAQGNAQVRLPVVRDMLGHLEECWSELLLKALLERDAVLLRQTLEQLVLKASQFTAVLDDMLALLHLAALSQFNWQAAECSEQSSEFVQELAQQVSPELLQLYYQLLISGKKELAYAPEPRIGLEMALLRALAFVPAEDLAPPSTPPSPAKSLRARLHLTSPDAAKRTTLAHVEEATTARSVEALAPELTAHAPLNEAVFPLENTPKGSAFVQAKVHESKQVELSSEPDAADVGTVEEESSLFGFAEQFDQGSHVQALSTEPLALPPDALAQETHSSYSLAESILARRGLKPGLADTNRDTPEKKFKAAAAASTNSLNRRDVSLKVKTKSLLDASSQSEGAVVADEKADAGALSAFRDIPPWEETPVSAQQGTPGVSGQVVDPRTSLNGVSASVVTSTLAASSSPLESQSEDSDASDESALSIQEGFNAASDWAWHQEQQELSAVASTVLEAPLFQFDGVISAENFSVRLAAQVDSWAALVDGLALGGLVRLYLLHSALQWHGDTAKLLVCQSQAHLDKPKFRQELQDVLSQAFNKAVTVEIAYQEWVESCPVAIQQRIEQERLVYVRELLEQDSHVVALQQLFQAEIVADSIRVN